MTTEYHDIAKIPLRVYTPIPDLRYNTTYAEDLEEMSGFLNTNMDAAKSLSPITCQIHKPNESLRLVPWFKPHGKVGVEEIDRGVYMFENNVWRSAIPVFDTLGSLETEIGVIAGQIDTLKASTDTYRANVAARLAEIQALQADVAATKLTTHGHMIRARQFACQNSWLFGTATANIPALSGTYDPVNQPDGHANVSFIDDPSDDDVWDAEGMKVISSVYRAYNHPWATLGAGWNPTYLSWLQNLQPWPANMTYRMSRKSWNRWHDRCQWYRSKKGLPELEYSEMSAQSFAINFGHYFSRNGAAYTDPFIAITFTGEDDTHVSHFSDAYVQLQYVLVAEAPDPLMHYVTGFRVWFSSYEISGTPTNPIGDLTDVDRSFKFNWMAYGQRRTPPIYTSWMNNLT